MAVGIEAFVIDRLENRRVPLCTSGNSKRLKFWEQPLYSATGMFFKYDIFNFLIPLRSSSIQNFQKLLGKKKYIQ